MKMLMLFGCVLALSACAAEDPTSVPTNDSVVTKKAAPAYQKPGAPVELRYQWLQKPGVGSAGRLQLTLIRHSDTAMMVNLRPDAQLQMSNNKQASFSVQKSVSGPMTEVVDVVPVAEGLHYLNVFVETGSGDGRRTRAFAIPVQVGKVSEKALAHPYLVEQDDGSKIIELPAESR